MTAIEEVLAALKGAPVLLEKAVASDGLPREPGLYAWWTVPGSIPGVPRCPHPSDPDLDLFYVGISPSRATSSGTLRSRVKGNHIGGNTGGSTFRLTLASLLFEEMGWKPEMADRPVLSRENNSALTAWQHEHLRLTWAVHPEPWVIEHEVIAHLKPPLNLAGSTHEFGSTVTAARRRFKDAAGPDAINTPEESLAGERTTEPNRSTGGAMTAGQGTTQPVTEADKKAGQIRIPTSGMTKNLFPSDKADIDVTFKDQILSLGWDPRIGSDRERSGVIRFRGADKDLLRESVRDEQVLNVTRNDNGEIEIS